MLWGWDWTWGRGDGDNPSHCSRLVGGSGHIGRNPDCKTPGWEAALDGDQTPSGVLPAVFWFCRGHTFRSRQLAWFLGLEDFRRGLTVKRRLCILSRAPSIFPLVLSLHTAVQGRASSSPETILPILLPYSAALSWAGEQEVFPLERVSQSSLELSFLGKGPTPLNAVRGVPPPPVLTLCRVTGPVTFNTHHSPAGRAPHSHVWFRPPGSVSCWMPPAGKGRARNHLQVC